MTQNDRINTETHSVCYLCGNHGEVLYHDLKDRLFGAPGEWTFRKCAGSDCGMVWLDPRPTAADIGKAYRHYYTHGQANHARQSYAARAVRAMLHTVSTYLLGLRRERQCYKRMYLDQVPPGRLLEVGCGNGKRLRRLRALGWDVAGQEIDPVAAEYVRTVKGIPVHLGPLETIELGEYDVVILSHVIEHVHDPVAMLSTCHRLLKEKGLLVVLTPNAASLGHRTFGAAWRGLEPPRHLHLFSSRTLKRIAQQAGFSDPRCWTTPVGAYGIGQNSPSLKGIIQTRQPVTTTCDVLRGFWFQVTACVVFLWDKNSGEECVLMVSK